MTTWKVIQRRSWTELPTPTHIIQRVESKARAELKITVDANHPNQVIFRRVDKSILEDEYVNPENQDEGADSDGNEDDDSVAPPPPQAQEA